MEGGPSGPPSPINYCDGFVPRPPEEDRLVVVSGDELLLLFAIRVEDVFRLVLFCMLLFVFGDVAAPFAFEAL
jgi:hypothetical protein